MSAYLQHPGMAALGGLGSFLGVDELESLPLEDVLSIFRESNFAMQVAGADAVGPAAPRMASCSAVAIKAPAHAEPGSSFYHPLAIATPPLASGLGYRNSTLSSWGGDAVGDASYEESDDVKVPFGHHSGRSSLEGMAWVPVGDQPADGSAPVLKRLHSDGIFSSAGSGRAVAATEGVANANDKGLLKGSGSSGSLRRNSSSDSCSSAPVTPRGGAVEPSGDIDIAHCARAEGEEYKCINPTHENLGGPCDLCSPPPLEHEESLYELVGDPGLKNGEKKLRRFILLSTEWNSAEERNLAADACGDNPVHERFAQTLRKKAVPRLRKSDLFRLARQWSFSSDIWQLKVLRRRRVAVPISPPSPTASGFDSPDADAPSAKRRRKAPARIAESASMESLAMGSLSRSTGGGAGAAPGSPSHSGSLSVEGPAGSLGGSDSAHTCAGLFL